MAQNITLQGASYSDVPSVVLPKTGGGTASFTDVTDTTAAANDVAAGKWFFTAAGVLTEGTSTGGGGTTAGTVTQDANGYLILDDDAPAGPTLVTKSITANGTYNASSDSADGYSSVTVNVSGGGGLVYETGTWTPAEDVNNYVINFNGTHTVAPWYYLIVDATGVYSNVIDSNYSILYYNYHQLTGAPINVSTSNTRYAAVQYFYRSSATAVTNGILNITFPYTYETGSLSNCSRFWATETGIKAYTVGDSRYWRTGRTYKWIAVWAPTS